MCTVSILAGQGDLPWVRVACNRDEQRSRPAGLPPTRRRFGECEALLPIDPLSGGTWIACNDAGLALVVLNVNDPRASLAAQLGLSSRGRLIPSLLSSCSLDEANEHACQIDATRFPPFRLILASLEGVDEFVSRGAGVVRSPRADLSTPQFFTSSGLGDEVVSGPRRQVFRRLLGSAEFPSAAAQDALHRHRWAERPEISISMERADACTVSLTTVEINAERVALDYHAGSPRDVAPAYSLELLRPGVLSR